MLPDAIDTTSSFNVKDGTKEGNSNNNHNDHSHNHLLEPPPAAPRRGRVSRRHSVGFAPEADRKVVEFDMLEEEMREMFWYSRDEYDIIKARNRYVMLLCLICVMWCSQSEAHETNFDLCEFKMANFLFVHRLLRLLLSCIGVLMFHYHDGTTV